MGYATEKVAVNGKTNLKVVLKGDETVLNDLVVVGYGTMKKSDISGSVATINKEQMERKVPVNIAQALQGAAAGVMVTNQDGAPGSKSAIRIRGIGSLNGSSAPLYVVDGVTIKIRDSTYGSTFHLHTGTNYWFAFLIKYHSTHVFFCHNGKTHKAECQKRKDLFHIV